MKHTLFTRLACAAAFSLTLSPVGVLASESSGEGLSLRAIDQAFAALATSGGGTADPLMPPVYQNAGFIMTTDSHNRVETAAKVDGERTSPDLCISASLNKAFEVARNKTPTGNAVTTVHLDSICVNLAAPTALGQKIGRHEVKDRNAVHDLSEVWKGLRLVCDVTPAQVKAGGAAINDLESRKANTPAARAFLRQRCVISGSHAL